MMESTQHDGPAGVLARYVYGLDDAGNRGAVTMTGSQYAGCPTGGCEEDYDYDALNRLDEVGYPGGGFVSYGYDRNGNRDEVTTGGVTTAYAYDRLDELTGIGATVSLEYDAGGNRDLSKVSGTTTRDYTWDAMNRLTQATVDASSVGYAYLADGTRSERTQGSATTGYVYDRYGLFKIVDDGTTSYVAGPGMTTEVTSAGVTYPLEDGLGSVRFRADDAGAVVGTTEYDVDGNVTASSGQQGLHGFTGEPYDPTSRLLDLRSRWYSPSTGVFLSRDTVAPSGSGTAGYNGYWYADGNPATNVDPTGHGVADVFWYLVAAIECALYGECQYRAKHGERGRTMDLLAKGGPTPQPSPLSAPEPAYLDFPPLPTKSTSHLDSIDKLAGRQNLRPEPAYPTVRRLGDFTSPCVDLVFEDYGCGFDKPYPSDCDRPTGLRHDSLANLAWDIEFNTSLPEFQCLQVVMPPMYGPITLDGGSLDWKADHCTKSPDQAPSFELPGYTFNFLPGCDRHDFGYRNLPKIFGVNDSDWVGSDIRKMVDDKLKEDLYYVCEERVRWLLEGECKDRADTYHLAVRNLYRFT